MKDASVEKVIREFAKIKKECKYPWRKLIIDKLSEQLNVDKEKSLELFKKLEDSNLVRYKGSLIKISPTRSVKEVVITKEGMKFLK